MGRAECRVERMGVREGEGRVGHAGGGSDAREEGWGARTAREENQRSIACVRIQGQRKQQ